MSDSNPPPRDLGKRGKRLWTGLRKEGAFTPAQLVLVEEACRTVDRLDKLNELLTGDAETWIDIIESRGDPEIAEVTINKPLAEARLQALTLKQLLAELRQSRGSAGAADAGGDDVDELAAARAKRLANAAGR